MNALASLFPGLRSSLSFISLTDQPTPIQLAETLGNQLGLDKLWIKRDDLSGNVYGGNKVRKLEYLLADALHRDCDSVVTFGAAGSNHALATSVYAHQLKLKCYAVMTDQPATPYVAATIRYHAWLETELVHADDYRDSIETANRIIAAHPGGANRVYWIPWGGSSWRGTTGFVNAGLEIAEQCGADDIPETIYLACGTMGTAVGLAIGLRLANLPTRVVAVKVVPNPVTNTTTLEKLLASTNNKLHDRLERFPVFDNPLENIEMREGFLGPGYAETTPECIEAVRLMDETEGLKLETTYTGKALAALIHDARMGGLAGRRVMFWNTYNSRPYPADLEAVGKEALPESFHKFLNVKNPLKQRI